MLRELAILKAYDIDNDPVRRLAYAAALVQRSATDHHLVFDRPFIWLLPPRLGSERISGVRRRAFG